MDLKDFIATSLTQIAEGILTASEALANTDAQVNPVDLVTHSNSAQGYGRLLLPGEGTRGRLVERVEFDVAVTAESSEAGKGGLKVGIASFGLNAGVEATDRSGSASRIQFGIPMVFPSKRNDK
ncbi:hypothetical protein OO258_16465 [Pseudomonas sp. DCB_BI]|uniref:trypco2 family protein n=1 Tax=Pseudomonas sp. DCB_BI TaxID=2993594 RepID=UPI00224B2203|nr:trypco2 family protein [Pseudomonas sp. DCB_BI]MCX2889834.1 hypothetical protein [Pseudomonas sp. DCB_BI]